MIYTLLPMHTFSPMNASIPDRPTNFRPLQDANVSVQAKSSDKLGLDHQKSPSPSTKKLVQKREGKKDSRRKMAEK
jgi:hypothetical protein